MKDLADLIERIGGATGPDRRLDGAIAIALTPGARTWIRGLAGGYKVGDEHKVADAFTASLDAALALVERVLPGWFIGVQQNRGVPAENAWSGILCPEDGDEVEITAPTPALALLSSMLRAVEGGG